MKYIRIDLFLGLLIFAMTPACLLHAAEIPDINNFNSHREFLESPACQENQLMVNACFAEMADHVERRLDEIYGRLPKSNELKQSQRKWLEYRRAECKWRANNFMGGSIHPTVIADCEAQLARRRISVLESQLNCGQDGGCPFPD